MKKFCFAHLFVFLLIGIFSFASAKERGILGVRAMPLNAEMKTKFSLKTNAGIVIDEIFPNTPAQKSGFKPGDIILKVDKKDIINTQTFATIMAAHSAGDKVDFVLVRKGKNISKKVTLVPAPQNQ